MQTMRQILEDLQEKVDIKVTKETLHQSYNIDWLKECANELNHNMISGLPGILFYYFYKEKYYARVDINNRVGVKPMTAQGSILIPCTSTLFDLFNRYPTCSLKDAPLDEIEKLEQDFSIRVFNGIMFDQEEEECEKS